MAVRRNPGQGKKAPTVQTVLPASVASSYFRDVSRGSPPRRETMLWPILFVVLVTALITGFAVFHTAGTLIENLNDHSELD